MYAFCLVLCFPFPSLSTHKPFWSCFLRGRSAVFLSLEGFASHKVGNVVIVAVTFNAFGLLHALVALRQLAERRERVGAKLVQDTWYELGEFLIFAIAVYSEGIGLNRGLD